MYEAKDKKLPKRVRSLYLRKPCIVDNAITDLGSIMKRFIQTGETPVSNTEADTFQYGLEDALIDAKRIEAGESAESVKKNPTDTFAELSDEEIDLIPDAPNRFLEYDEFGNYIAESATANKRATNFYRAKEREKNGKSVMAQETAKANAIKFAESQGFKKGETEAK